MECDVIGGFVVNGVGQPILFGFILVKLPGYKVFSEPEKVLYKKLNKSVWITIAFYLENDNNEEADFNREMLTLTLQMIKI